MKTNPKIYTLTGAGTEIPNFNVTDTYDKYIIKGSATSIGNYAISVTGTPQLGDTFIIKYKGVLDITTNGNTFSILGQSLTQNQLLSDLDIEAYYDGSAWIVEIKPSFTSTIVETSNIVNQALTNAKAATMAAYTVKANNTGSSATPQDVDRCTLVSACAWSLTGNAGTTPGTNFIGTIDNQDLVFKRFDTQVAKFYQTSISFGEDTLLNIESGGLNNVGIGYNTAQDLTIGDENVIIGSTSGNTIITGSENTIIGANADVDSSSASNRIAIGEGAISDADFQFAIPNNCINIKLRGVNYVLPSADGTPGQVLTTDGSGYLSWA
jgi:hypothetical protein